MNNPRIKTNLLEMHGKSFWLFCLFICFFILIASLCSGLQYIFFHFPYLYSTLIEDPTAKGNS